MSHGTDSARYLYEQNSIPIAAYTATTTGTAVSIAGCGSSVDVVIRAGTISAADGSNYVTFTVTQGATNAAAGAVDDAQYDPVNGWDRIINATTEGNATYRINFLVKPDYDWIKVVMTEVGTFNGILGAWVEFEPSSQPAITT